MRLIGIAVMLALAAGPGPARGAAAGRQLEPVVPKEQRGRADAERSGIHDASNIRTVFWNYGMVGDYPPDPINVNLAVFHSAEVPKGSGMNYTDGITPFVLTPITQTSGIQAYIMETGYRERQAESPYPPRHVMRFEPRPGYFEPSPNKNPARSPAISTDPRSWPAFWPDKLNDPFDPGWRGSWNGYFGKLPGADQESFTVMDDDQYDAWDFVPDSRDPTRKGLGLRVEVRGFQWSNPQAANVIFWHYDIVNESTADYDSVVFGLYMDSGVGGSALSCDGVAESDDDNAFWDKSYAGLNLVYTWDRFGHGVDRNSTCDKTGYLGYAYLETPGNSFDALDNDDDGITDEVRDGGPGELIEGQANIRAYVTSSPRYNLAKFEAFYGPLEERPAYKRGSWWTGDEDMDWIREFDDVGEDGVAGTHDVGEGDGKPTAGEPDFDRTDLNESDQIGLTGFKFNRIRAGIGNPGGVDGIVFYTDENDWPEKLYRKFTDSSENPFDPPLADNYNIAFLFASGPFALKAGKRERFSLALAYGADLQELRENVGTVQIIYNANYLFAEPPPLPTVTAETGDGYVRLSWDDVAERGVDRITHTQDFEGYRIYRATDYNFQDVKVISNGSGTGPVGNGKPSAQFDLVDGKRGFTRKTIDGVAYDLGRETGITHTWTDTTATNGQEYFYAVCAYDFGYEPGPPERDVYPSENPITVHRTTRGGYILPRNVVRVRPNAKVAGFTGAAAGQATHVAGPGNGTVGVEVVNSNLVPDGHVFRLNFITPSRDSLRATSYMLTDTTLADTLFSTGSDLDGLGSGPVGAGLLPVVATPLEVTVDSARTGWDPRSDVAFAWWQRPLSITYIGPPDFPTALPNNQKRPGYPADLTITFEDTVQDTSIRLGPLLAVPAKFKVVAHTLQGDRQLDFAFSDVNGDSTLSSVDDFISIVTYSYGQPTTPKGTWRVQIEPPGLVSKPIVPPRHGDVYQLRLVKPLGTDDVFDFSTTGQRVDAGVASTEASHSPYVVPNPYIASASFEPARFTESGRGERRIEFRGLAQNSTIRIYTVRGDLVQTLHQDGSVDGSVPWNLRTKDNLEVAPGLYIFQVEAAGAAAHIGKFAIIK